MRRSGPMRLLAVLLLLSVALLALQQSAVSQSILPADALGHCPPLPPGSASLDAPGNWAIRPHVGDTTPPTYSEQDARDYVQRHGAWDLANGASPPRITSARFMSARSACVETGQPVTRSDDALVCLVTLRGDFATPAGPPSAHHAVGNTEYLIFDATTGNLIGITLSGH